MVQPNAPMKKSTESQEYTDLFAKLPAKQLPLREAEQATKEKNPNLPTHWEWIAPEEVGLIEADVTEGGLSA